MKKAILILLVGLISIVTFGQLTKPETTQNKNANQWNTDNPFNTDVFVENLGQFDSWAKTAEPIKYAINSSDKVFFTQKGMIIRCDKVTSMSEEEKEEFERDKGREPTPEIDTYYVTMTWEGCNENAVLESSDQSEGYFTFGEKGFGNVQAKGYKKLVYKNIYSGIDVEYIIPKKGGIKYSLILHPGADISKVKMKYTGDVSLIKKAANGDINITTPAGDIIDHAPQSIIKETAETITSRFEITDNSVSFAISQHPTSNIQHLTIIIDPWTIIPTSLTTDNSAFDIAYDNYGNVYAGGGTVPFKVSKFNSSGTLLWTFTNPAGWAMSTYYSKFCVIPATGTVFISEAYNVSVAPSIMKINQAGNLALLAPNFGGSNEIWKIFYNNCTNQLIGFGGGTSNQNNLHILTDTSLTNETGINFNGYSGGCCNDITDAIMDNNGDIYALMSSASGTPSVNNHLQKSIASANYLPPCTFDVPSGYTFDECYNYGITGFLGGNTVRSNALAVNNSYLFSYDGKTLKAWNKTNGTLLNSVIVDAGYGAGSYRTHEGIAADECNNVYVGGTNMVHVFAFNGNIFIALPSITNNINGEVYDIKLNRLMGLLNISGLGFVQCTPSIGCNANIIYLCDTLPPYIIFADDNINICSNSVTLDAGQYLTNYMWSNGATTQTTTVTTSGMYYVTATWNLTNTIIDSILVTFTQPYLNLNLGNDTTICGSGSVSLNAGSGFSNYMWNIGSANQSITVNQTGAYSIITSDTANCIYTDTVIIIINPAQSLFLGNDTVICNYGAFTLDASVGFDTYLWSTGATTQTINIQSSGTYSVTATNNFCAVTATDAITIIVYAIPVVNAGVDQTICNGTSTTLNATGIGTFHWSPSSGLSCTNCSNPTAHPTNTTTYGVTVTNSNGCTASDDVTINVINANISITSAHCGLSNGTATVSVTGGSGSFAAIWNTSPPQSGQTIINLAPGTYTVSVTDFIYGCTVVSSATVGSVTVPSVYISNIINTNCGMYNGSMIAVVNGGTAPISYLWNSIPAQTSQTLINVMQGNYCVTVTDANNCQASDCDVVGAFPYSAPEICMVSVDTSNNFNLVIWEKPVTTGINSYLIFRETNIAGIYNLIGTQNYSNFSIYIDSSSNSLQQPYRYELDINDNCGFTSPTSPYHQTVHLTVNAGMGGSWNLNWNNYEGFSFNTYNIYRGTNSGNLTLLNSVSSNVTSYSDLNPPSGIVYYLIEVVRPTACNPSKSFSSTISNVASSLGLGINETSLDYVIQIYPDPATNDITIVSQLKGIIELYNVTGQLLKTTATNSIKTNLDVSPLPAGLYIVEVKTEKGVAVKKFVKE